jgi:hypothetical protein
MVLWSHRPRGGADSSGDLRVTALAVRTRRARKKPGLDWRGPAFVFQPTKRLAAQVGFSGAGGAGACSCMAGAWLVMPGAGAWAGIPPPGAGAGAAPPSHPHGAAAAQPQSPQPPQPPHESQPHDDSQPHEGSQPQDCSQPHDCSQQTGSGQQQLGAAHAQRHLRARMRANKPPHFLRPQSQAHEGSQHAGRAQPHLRPNRPAVASCSSPIMAKPTMATSTATVDKTIRFMLKLLPKYGKHNNALTAESPLSPLTPRRSTAEGLTLYGYS